MQSLLILFLNVTISLIEMSPALIYNISLERRYFCMHNKEYALKLVQDKQNGINNYSYSQIASLILKKR